MQADFWHERWENNQIGFHQQHINPHLKNFWHQLALPANAPVFVPLCGKSNDIAWLAEQGHPVTGIEISRVAVEAFFHEHSLQATVSQQGSLEYWRADNITLICGDFFALGSDQLTTIKGVYDRASLIALPPEMRQSYVQHFYSIVPAAAPVLLVTLEYDQNEMSGPPFSVSETEVRQFYSQRYHIENLQSQDVLEDEPHFRSKGLTRLTEKIYRLRPEAPA